MRRETVEWYCDACGRKIEGMATVTIRPRNNAGIEGIEFVTIGEEPMEEYVDLCRECTKSFLEWKAERRAER